ncbi:reverse transcriptase domain-containing protein [Trichonephila clavata]|uniref:Reverse transcriptase domain-containing protein n=1 Tax=Trichonephila clavata TaxID=2740835 RepID=A0A8X6IQA7_TRICU|nr:reverse transcriptase domain-containing protein [Trichonephila clavata]
MSWKNSRVVLIHKKGDLHNISNWSPTSLLSTMGKVFSSVLAARLSSWATINNRLSPFQKGFRESEDYVEHNFLLEQAIVDAKHSRSNLALAWLDLENSFGPIPHSFILKSLYDFGVPSSVSHIISSLYSGASSEIRCGAGWTLPIPMEVGVHQGCPLSAILFNLSLVHVIRPTLEVDTDEYSLFYKPLRCLAYADLILIGKSRESLQILLDSLVHTAARIGSPPPRNALPSLSIMRGALALDLLDVHTIGTRFALSSSDATVSDVARAGLVSVVRKRTRVVPDQCTLADFLNGSTSGWFISESSDYSTIWSRACHATQGLCNKIRFEWAASEATDSRVLHIHRSPNPVVVAQAPVSEPAAVGESADSHFTSNPNSTSDATPHVRQERDATQFVSQGSEPVVTPPKLWVKQRTCKKFMNSILS